MRLRIALSFAGLFVLLAAVATFSDTAPVQNDRPECGVFSPYRGLARFNVGYGPGTVRFDDNGVIQFAQVSAERAYHFTLISRWGLSGLKEYCASGSQEALASAIAQADKLIANLSPIAGTSAKTIIWPFSGGGAPAGEWASGISNSATADLLVHLALITGSEQYLSEGVAIANSFTIPVQEGGMTWEMERGGHFFEEYASMASPTRHVLNGHILAMMHLHAAMKNMEAIGVVDDALPPLEDTFADAVTVFRTYMDDFDVTTLRHGETTRYDISTFGTRAPHEYPHRIHWRGALWLAEMYDDDLFRAKAEKWGRRYAEACAEAQVKCDL